jgi:hypothetical protein
VTRSPFILGGRALALALALALVVAACAAPTHQASVAPSTPPPQPVTATEADGRLRLILELPKDTWAAGEPITGSATLSLEPGPDVLLSGSGGPIGFSYAEVNGTRNVEPAFTADCAPHPLSAAAPIVRSLSKSGAWDAEEPDGEFYQAFFAGPDVRLPAGDWDIRVVLALTEGGDCAGRSLDLEPVVRIHVTEAAAPSP